MFLFLSLVKFSLYADSMYQPLLERSLLAACPGPLQGIEWFHQSEHAQCDCKTPLCICFVCRGQGYIYIYIYWEGQGGMKK